MNKSKWTTIFGVCAAVCTFLSQAFPKYQAIFFSGAAMFTALLGIFSKDWNVTGGVTKQATPMVQASDITKSTLEENKQVVDKKE
jgi:hypothetical protein